MITVHIQSETPRASANLFGRDTNGETFSTFDITTPTVKMTIFTSDPDILMQIAQSAANMARQLARQLKADAAAKAVLAQADDEVPIATAESMEPATVVL